MRTRRIAAARKAIAAYLREHSHGPDVTFQACDWYRRLGFNALGFQLLLPGLPLRSSLAASTSAGRRSLWAARFLNLMGAPELAIPLLDRLELRTADEFRVAGIIRLTNYEYASAAECFERMRALAPEDWTYLARVGLLSLADARCGLGDPERALDLAAQVLERSPEPTLRAICHQAEGEYRARTGDLERALPPLIAARRLFSPEDRTADMGVLHKWLGFVRAKRGEESEARDHFRQARSILMTSALRPEAWLEIFRLESEAGLLAEADRPRLLHYPGTSAGFRQLLPRAQPAEFRAGPGYAPLLTINPNRGEWKTGAKWSPALPRELQLLSALVIAGPWGMNPMKAKCLLWPGEVHSFLQLDDRLHQLLRRIRSEHQFRVGMDRGMIRLSDSGARNVLVQGGWPGVPGFLVERSSFRPREMDRYYDIARTRRSFYLRKWTGRGWIRRVGADYVIRADRIGVE